MSLNHKLLPIVFPNFIFRIPQFPSSAATRLARPHYSNSLFSVLEINQTSPTFPYRKFHVINPLLHQCSRLKTHLYLSPSCFSTGFTRIFHVIHGDDVLLPSWRIYTIVGGTFFYIPFPWMVLATHEGVKTADNRVRVRFVRESYAILLIRSTGKRDIWCACAAQLITYDKTAMFMYTGGKHEPMNRVTRTSWLVSMKNHFAERLNDSRVKRESIVLEMNFIEFIENSKIDHRLVVDQFFFFLI